MITLLIDGNFLAHQSYYAMGNMMTEDAVPSGVVFGVLLRCLDLGHRFKTNRLVFCWDSKNSIRRQVYPTYKAQRREKSPEKQAATRILYDQINALKNTDLPLIGWTNQLEQSGLEADDMLAMHARCASPSVIVTSDEDLLQCLNSNVTIYNPAKHQLRTEATFRKEYGIEPDEWVLVKALAGCRSDNVRGIAGVGEATALKYLCNTLPSGQKRNAILRNRDRALRINLPLVRLPHAATRLTFPLLSDTLSCDNLLVVAARYEMQSFFSETLLQRWQALFVGKFEGIGAPSRYDKVTRPRAVNRMRNRRRSR